MPDLRQEKVKKFTTIVLTLTASMILGLFAISPTLSTIANLQKQIEDNKYVDAQLVSKITNLSILQQKYANLKNDLPIVYDAIPTSAEIPPLMAEIQTIAKTKGLQLDNFQTYSVDLSTMAMAKVTNSSFDFGFSGKGDYSSIINFIDQLLNFQRVITIGNVTISKLDNNQKNNGLLQLNFKGTVLFKE
jgi:Tfp pilus assembly protein PilO